MRTLENNPAPAVRAVYAFAESLPEKIGKVAREIYGASGVRFSDRSPGKTRTTLPPGATEIWRCASPKTQYSLTDDPKRLGAPTGWTLNITDASLSAGAGFVVAIAGNMMLMPGLPKVSRAASIDVDDSGEIIGV